MLLPYITSIPPKQHLPEDQSGKGLSMSTGQTLFTIFAFGILTTVLLRFYEQNANVQSDMSRNRDRIVATSVAKSYIEMSQALEFDQASMLSDTTIRTPYAMTPLNCLGKDPLDGTGIDDFDDLNGFEGEEVMADSSAIYNVSCRVYYVHPEHVDEPSSTPTFVKRLDVKVWRADAGVPTDMPIDTVRLFTTSAYIRPTKGMVRPPAPPPPPPPPPPTTPFVFKPSIPRSAPPRPPRPTTRPIPKPTSFNS
jgi:hypothetical protein